VIPPSVAVASAGKDATRLFDSFHSWVAVDAILGVCFVGHYGSRPAPLAAQSALAAPDLPLALASAAQCAQQHSPVPELASAHSASELAAGLFSLLVSRRDSGDSNPGLSAHAAVTAPVQAPLWAALVRPAASASKPRRPSDASGVTTGRLPVLETLLSDGCSPVTLIRCDGLPSATLGATAGGEGTSAAVACPAPLGAAARPCVVRVTLPRTFAGPAGGGFRESCLGLQGAGTCMLAVKVGSAVPPSAECDAAARRGCVAGLWAAQALSHPFQAGWAELLLSPLTVQPCGLVGLGASPGETTGSEAAPSLFLIGPLPLAAVGAYSGALQAAALAGAGSSPAGVVDADEAAGSASPIVCEEMRILSRLVAACAGIAARVAAVSPVPAPLLALCRRLPAEAQEAALLQRAASSPAPSAGSGSAGPTSALSFVAAPLSHVALEADAGLLKSAPGAAADSPLHRLCAPSGKPATTAAVVVPKTTILCLASGAEGLAAVVPLLYRALAAAAAATERVGAAGSVGLPATAVVAGKQTAALGSRPAHAAILAEDAAEEDGATGLVSDDDDEDADGSDSGALARSDVDTLQPPLVVGGFPDLPGVSAEYLENVAGGRDTEAVAHAAAAVTILYFPRFSITPAAVDSGTVDAVTSPPLVLPPEEASALALLHRLCASRSNGRTGAVRAVIVVPDAVPLPAGSKAACPLHPSGEVEASTLLAGAGARAAAAPPSHADRAETPAVSAAVLPFGTTGVLAACAGIGLGKEASTWCFSDADSAPSSGKQQTSASNVWVYVGRTAAAAAGGSSPDVATSAAPGVRGGALTSVHVQPTRFFFSGALRQLRTPVRAAPGGGVGGDGKSTHAARPVVPEPQENVVCVMSDSAALCAASAAAVVGEAGASKAAPSPSVSAAVPTGLGFAAAAEDACRQAYYLASQLVRL